MTFIRNSILIFCAYRIADGINLFGNLYIVPKYVSMDDLGALLPITTFVTTLALPAYAFSMTFAKELNTLALRQERGRMKTLMRSVFTGVAFFSTAAMAAAAYLAPKFIEHVRIDDGALAFIVIFSAFIG